MAGIRQPLTDILTRLMTLMDLSGNPLFAYAAVFNDQFDQMEHGKVEAIPLPAAFVEIIKPQQYQEIGGGLLQADVTWRIHIAMEQLDAGDGTMEQNLDIFEVYRNRLAAGLRLFKPTACGVMFRTGEEQDYKHTNLYHYTVSFKCGFIDSKGSPYDPDAGVYIYTTPPIGLEVDNIFSDTDES